MSAPTVDRDAAEPPLLQVGAAHTAACIRTELVERAHGHAAEVFDESSSDTLLAGEPVSAELAESPEENRDAVVDSTPAGSQTEPAADATAGETGTVTTPRGDRA